MWQESGLWQHVHLENVYIQVHVKTLEYNRMVQGIRKETYFWVCTHFLRSLFHFSAHFYCSLLDLDILTEVLVISLDVSFIRRSINIVSERGNISVTIWGFTGARRGGRRFVFPLQFLFVMFPMFPFVLFTFLLEAFHLLFLSLLVFIRWQVGSAALLLLCGLLLTWWWSRSGE